MGCASNTIETGPILTNLNQRRDDFAANPPAGFPKPAYMPHFTWDDTMGELAQGHADLCDPTPQPEEGFAQTTFFTTDPSADVLTAVDKWWRRTQNGECYDYGSDTCDDACSDHFGCDAWKYMMSSSTTKMGCAVNNGCQKLEGTRVYNGEPVACTPFCDEGMEQVDAMGNNLCKEGDTKCGVKGSFCSGLQDGCGGTCPNEIPCAAGLQCALNGDTGQSFCMVRADELIDGTSNMDDNAALAADMYKGMLAGIIPAEQAENFDYEKLGEMIRANGGENFWASNDLAKILASPEFMTGGAD
eukprot:gene5379-5401_t